MRKTNENLWDTAHSPCWEFSLFWMSPSHRERERERERPVQLYEQTCDVAIAMDLEVAEVHLNCYCAHDNECFTSGCKQRGQGLCFVCLFLLCIPDQAHTESEVKICTLTSLCIRLDTLVYFQQHGCFLLLHWTHHDEISSTHSFSANCPNISAKHIALFHADSLLIVYLGNMTSKDQYVLKG